MRLQKSLLPICLLMLFCATSCTEKETDLGSEFQDPSSLYDGISDTISGSAEIVAWTTFNDSIKTSGYTTGMIGYYSDAVFGSVTAKTFTQLSLSGTGGVDLSAYTIDSIELALVLDEKYPNDSCTVNLKISQLTEGINKDSNYYAFSDIATGSVLFNDLVTIPDTSKCIAVVLNSTANDLFRNRFDSPSDFIEQIKGLCIELVDNGTPAMLTINFAATATKMKVLYHDNNNVHSSLDILIGSSTSDSKTTHFSQFLHSYNGEIQHTFNNNDSIAGTEKLYLEPLGGTYVHLNIDSFVKQFHQAHPKAIIHYAELLLPTHTASDNLKPDRIVANKVSSTGSIMPIPDYSSAYTASGYDGKYQESKGFYRIRITQHLQYLVTAGKDYGTLLELFGSRSSARRTIINGTDSSNPIKIHFIYSE